MNEPGEIGAPPRTGPDAAGGRDERVSTLLGDRVCIACGFNLCGQPVLRERHYRMFIVRCPECSAVAALQEYPLLGRWANRWAALLGAAWLLTLMGAMLASGGVLFGMSMGIGMGASQKFAEHIGLAQRDWYLALDETARKAYPAWLQQQLDASTYGATIWVDPKWWDAQEPGAVFRGAGGWGGAVTWAALWLWVPVALVGLAIGVFFAIALLGVRRSRLLTVALGPLGLAGLFALLAYTGPASRPWGGMYMSSDLAQRAIAPWVIAMTLAFALPCIWAGTWSGRPLARLAVRTLLPARLRPSLSALWTTDGLDPPGARDARART